MTPYYQDDLVTIYHGDFRELLEVSADLVVADPPYGQTSLAWDRRIDYWPVALPATARSMWVFGTLRMFMDNESDFFRGAWKLSQDVVWEKHNGSYWCVHCGATYRARFLRGEWKRLPGDTAPGGEG